MLATKLDTITLYRIVVYKEGCEELSFKVDRDRAIIGSAKSCDFIIEDQFVSHYHAMIEHCDDGINVKDLGSINGILINGKKTEQGFALPGDIIEIGPNKFLVEQFESDESGFTKIDEKTKQYHKKSINDLPPLPPKEGLEVIDGEYCDIKFDQNLYRPTDTLLFEAIALDDYINFDERNDATGIIKANSTGQSLEVTITSMGVALSVDYVSLKNKSIQLSGNFDTQKEIYLPILEQNQTLELASVKDKNISLNELEGFTRLISGDFNIYTKGTVQIFVRISNHPPTLKMADLIERDPNFYKQTGSVFGGFMALMLLILFVDTPEPPKPEKKRTVIFKQTVVKGPTVTEKASQNPANINKDQGIQKKQISNEAPKMAKAKSLPSKTKTVQKKVQAPSKSVAKKVQKKKFNFKVAKGVTKFLKKKVNFKLDPSQSTNNTSSSSLKVAAASSAKSANKSFSTQISDGSSNLGSNSIGNAALSAGAKGLAAKSGINTAYSAPKTVVLGSIDPELLRKILREYLPQFHYCYQNELDTKQDLIKGVIDLKFRINGSGKVSNIDIASKKTAFSRKGVNCMAQVLKMIDFPRPKGGGIVDVKQPLNFQSERSRI
ncbi:AgmX/PglI C-terminal domain-containing protein [Halobacteriovorax sp. GB3]|uniref:AgmX/PglI C-terminal domain-containing protein n=1 Tax=Halobacteriovorax sp. GB3 TaxID=2719615 RepID=UPI002362E970|nr:AgmX/PglI C-terminal domain-containing protein [Halobacteriovorax sp. GB3]MDD0853420.1 AgmX/PglI C-terminal domain-containing protein [Halobacteriovorax sp. GB3]